MARGLIAGIVILVAVTLYSLFDCAARDSAAIRIMPKWGWLLVILFIPVIGLIMWFIFGRGTLGSGGGTGGARRKGPSAPDDDPDYLRRISDDMEQERRRKSHEDEERGANGADTGFDGDHRDQDS